MALAEIVEGETHAGFCSGRCYPVSRRIGVDLSLSCTVLGRAKPMTDAKSESEWILISNPFLEP
jgi:hypothetical protein